MSGVLTLICHLSPCVESFQSCMNVLSQLDSEGEVNANPTAAAASVTSGINPVSRNGYYCFFPFLYMTVQSICRF